MRKLEDCATVDSIFRASSANLSPDTSPRGRYLSRGEIMGGSVRKVVRRVLTPAISDEEPSSNGSSGEYVSARSGDSSSD